MATAKKKSQVELLGNILKESANFLIVEINKVSHKSLESLRRSLKKNKSSIKVIKNTLFQKTINLSADNPLFPELKKKFFPLKGSSALITLNPDWSEALKTIYDFIQKDKNLAFKFGLLDSSLYPSEDVENIAKLPGRNELIAKIIGSLKSPTSKLVYSMRYNTNKLVYILQSKSQKT
ncbi:50S ribosomal protein L10 [Microgenomates bacterium UTCPR1]|jgi:large subunit ribosomal protein L10|nr:50S ribosomal protein L10 [Patescibacteria group bacterium]OQY69292.1 MAG: 50S ribosomal protein L10 [Microgenomates bacterium UTCPR1]